MSVDGNTPRMLIVSFHVPSSFIRSYVSDFRGGDRGSSLSLSRRGQTPNKDHTSHTRRAGLSCRRPSPATPPLPFSLAVAAHAGARPMNVCSSHTALSCCHTLTAHALLHSAECPTRRTPVPHRHAYAFDRHAGPFLVAAPRRYPARRPCQSQVTHRSTPLAMPPVTAALAGCTRARRVAGRTAAARVRTRAAAPSAGAPSRNATHAQAWRLARHPLSLTNALRAIRRGRQNRRAQCTGCPCTNG